MQGLLLSITRGALYVGLFGIAAGIARRDWSLIGGGVALAAVGLVLNGILAPRSQAASATHPFTTRVRADPREVQAAFEKRRHNQQAQIAQLVTLAGAGDDRVLRAHVQKHRVDEDLLRLALHAAVESGNSEAERNLLRAGAKPKQPPQHRTGQTEAQVGQTAQSVQCPNPDCKRPIPWTPSRAGHPARCPSCRHRFVFPSAL